MLFTEIYAVNYYIDERVIILELNTKNIMAAKIQRGYTFLNRLEESSLNGYEENTKLLLKIIDENKNTEIGRKYDFASIKTVKDYIKKVPFSQYEDYENDIKRIMQGEKDILFSREITHFATSSGSSGEPKYVPMCLEAEQLFAAYTHGLCFAVMDKEIGENMIEGRGVSFTEVRFKPTENGISTGAVSGKVRYQHKDNENIVYTTPMCISYPKGKMNFPYLHLRFALMEEDLSFITCTFMTAAADTFKYLEDNWQILVEDIAQGTISSDVRVPFSVREEVLPLLKPMEKRAKFLKEEFEKGFDGILPRIWPKLKFLFGIGGGSFKVYTEKVKRYLGDVKIHYSVYSASEGIFAAPIKSNTEDMVLIPFSNFYEFREINDESGKTVTLDKLEAGKDYEVIITNLSGLYRYKIKDVIRVTGFFNTLPKIQFLYRINQLINIAGEKTNDDVMNTVMALSAKELNIDMTEYSVYADTASSPGRYIVFLEAKSIDGKTKDVKKAQEVIEKYLCKFNHSYEDKIAHKKLSHLKVCFLREKSYAVYRELMAAKGVSPNQLKPVRVIDNEFRENFFFSMEEKL